MDRDFARLSISPLPSFSLFSLVNVLHSFLLPASGEERILPKVHLERDTLYSAFPPFNIRRVEIITSGFGL